MDSSYWDATNLSIFYLYLGKRLTYSEWWEFKGLYSFRIQNNDFVDFTSGLSDWMMANIISSCYIYWTLFFKQMFLVLTLDLFAWNSCWYCCISQIYYTWAFDCVWTGCLHSVQGELKSNSGGAWSSSLCDWKSNQSNWNKHKSKHLNSTWKHAAFDLSLEPDVYIYPNETIGKI